MFFTSTIGEIRETPAEDRLPQKKTASLVNKTLRSRADIKNAINIQEIDLTTNLSPLLLRRIGLIHSYAHCINPLVDIEKRDGFDARSKYIELNGEPDLTALAELNKFSDDLITILQSAEIMVTSAAAHMLWHVPNGFESLYSFIGKDPQDIIYLFTEFLDDLKPSLDRYVSPEVQSNLPREYAFQVGLRHIIEESNGCYLKPLGVTSISSELDRFTTETAEAVSIWMKKHKLF